MLARDFYTVIPDNLVSPKLRHICRSVASYLTEIFDLPSPLIVYVDQAPSEECTGDVHLSISDFDINVPAAIIPSAPNTIWLLVGDERQMVQALAHEIGHCAELLGRTEEREDVEDFPRMLANAVATTYTTGIGWIERLINSSFYFRALAEGRYAVDIHGGWARQEYWSRLARTRGMYGYISSGVRGDASRVFRFSSAWHAVLATGSPDLAPDRGDPRPYLVSVPRDEEL